MDKNYQQTKGSSAVSNISRLSDESSDDSSEQGSNPQVNEDAGDRAEAKDCNAAQATKKASKANNSQHKMKCIYCWSKKTLTDV